MRTDLDLESRSACAGYRAPSICTTGSIMDSRAILRIDIGCYIGIILRGLVWSLKYISRAYVGLFGAPGVRGMIYRK